MSQIKNFRSGKQQLVRATGLVTCRDKPCLLTLGLLCPAIQKLERKGNEMYLKYFSAAALLAQSQSPCPDGSEYRHRTRRW
jgi:hypothetical protein